VARLLLVFAGGVGLAIAMHAVWILVLVLAFVAMVMLHELGHFATAKWSGMKVTEYFFGFGPRLWSIRRGETEYGIKALPAGGYVKITGMTMLEDVDPGDEPRSYRQSTFPRRVLVASAGSLVHGILAFALLWAALVFVGQPTGTSVSIESLLKFAGSASPAQLAGFRAGDSIVSVNGRAIHTYGQLSALIGPSVGRTLHVVVRRGGHLVTLSVRPVDGRHVVEVSGGQREHLSFPKAAPGIIGVGLFQQYSDVSSNPFVAIGRAGSMFGTIVADTGRGLAQIFSFHGLSSFAHQVVTAGNQHSSTSGSGGGSSSANNTPQVTSILGVIQIGSQLQGDFWDLLLLLAQVNLFIGIVNLFPMLPLDGGHVMIAVYERIRSRKGKRYHADVMKLLPVAYVFLAFIIVLGMAALYSNIVQPAHLSGG
jgi:membrane-associated protease RseP (regulator of RpoE activity)